MADTTDRPPGAPAAPPAEAVTPRPAPPAGRDLGPGGLESLPAVGAAEPYRPLSGLALAGLALAVLYSLVVVVGGLMSFRGTDPFLLPAWTALLPLAAVALGWVARRRVQTSEGALAGAALATWGIGLALGVGLSYWAY